MAELAVLIVLEYVGIIFNQTTMPNLSISVNQFHFCFNDILILNLVISIYLNISQYISIFSMSSGYNPLFLPTFDLDVEALCTLGGPGGSATVEVLPAGALRPPVQYFDRCLDHCWIIFDLFFWRYMMYI